MPRRITVAIDGPAGAGKSTVAKRLAAELGYSLVDTGAIYRSIALLADLSGVAWQDEPAVAEIARQLQISFVMQGESNHVSLFYRGVETDVSMEIRTPRVSAGASQVSSLPLVRAALLGLQRRFAEGGGVVLEGRDIGTVVCPNAEAKFFLTASVASRAQRRHQELLASGEEVTLDETRRAVEARDYADMNRPIAPLRQAPDAVFVDASERNVDDIVAEMTRLVRSKEHL
jgi:CMP/dCMP kinase